MTDPKYVRPRYLDPDNPKSGKKDFYRSPILTEFDKHYTRKASTVFCSRTAADRASVPPPGEALASDGLTCPVVSQPLPAPRQRGAGSVDHPSAPSESEILDNQQTEYARNGCVHQRVHRRIPNQPTEGIGESRRDDHVPGIPAPHRHLNLRGRGALLVTLPSFSKSTSEEAGVRRLVQA